MRKGSLVGGLAALAIAITALAAASRANAQAGPGTAGPWIMGPGMMGPGMMGCGPGMMGWGPGTMGWGWSPNTAPANLNLSVNDVQGSLQRWMAVVGNPRLKVGNVTEKDANTITADIVTTDKDALVERFNIDRRTGIYNTVE